MFQFIKLLDIIVFIGGGIFLFIIALVGFFYKKKRLSTTSSILFILLTYIGIYSHFIAPYDLKIKEYLIHSDKIKEDTTIVFLADIQTDEIGEYEKSVFEKIQNINPDILLFGGDYIQQYDTQKHIDGINALNLLISKYTTNIKTKIAVRGNVDSDYWSYIFSGTNTEIIEDSKQFYLGNIVITALSEEDSFDSDYIYDNKDNKYHIILGHSPDYFLGKNNSNLLLAGHTHGGQIQLPFLGPLLTFSQVSRNWASGMNKVGEDKYLIVSNGIGIERGHAPEIRFFTNPEIVVIKLFPRK